MSLAKAVAKAPHLANWILTPWLKAAIEEIGQAEVAGAKSNPRIMAYRQFADIKIGGDDSVVPWCAIFINAVLAVVKVKGSGSAMARSFVKHPDFVRLEKPVVGCITVISSSRGPASGHVFFYTGENALFLQGLGGNQNDSVSIEMFQKAKLVGHFWPRGVPLPPAPFDQPVRLARPLLPHEKKAVRDA
ncbi:MAG: TIGR02594 family protein [Rhabdaerophilum sp.]